MSKSMRWSSWRGPVIKPALLLFALLLCVMSAVVLSNDEKKPKAGSQKEIEKPPFFELELSVGIIDLTIGYLETTSSIDGFDSEIEVDGRVAFYLKGKIRGKYLLTAQLDTGEGPVDEIFGRLDRRGLIFEKIDPDRYYPVYGDQSTLVKDVETQGRIYLRLEWDESLALLGNYQVHLNDTNLVKYNRSLYGLNLDFKHTQKTANPRETQIFIAKPFTVHSHDIIRSTGGSLYYLKHADVVIASEQIQVEVRDSISGNIIGRVAMVYGRDFYLDYAQGRLVLLRSLAAIASSGLITSNGPLDGDQLYLVIDYDYEDTAIDNPSYGLRSSYTWGKRFQLGGSFIKESIDTGGDYQIYGLDFKYQLSPGIRISGEIAKSEQYLANRFYSEDGGLTYSAFEDTSLLGGSNAWRIGIDMTYPRMFGMNDFTWGSYYQFQGEGFSTPEGQVLSDTDKFGVVVNGEFRPGYGLLLRYDATFKESDQLSREGVFQLRQKFGSFQLIEELRDQYFANLITDSEYNALLGAVRLDYQLSDRVMIYGSQQFTLSRSDSMPENDRFTLGAEIGLSKTVLLNLEGSRGSLGDAALIGLKQKVTEKNEAYGRLEYENDRFGGTTWTTIVGDKGRVSEKLDIYAEHQYGYGTYENSLSDLFGVDYYFKKGWMASFNVSISLIEPLADRPPELNPFPGLTDPPATEELNRRILGAGLLYKKDSYEARTGLQIRFDKGDTTDIKQYLITQSFKGLFSKELQYLLRFSYSLSWDQLTDEALARFGEGTFGMAYRPVDNDRLNMIGKITYRDDLSPIEQEDGTVPWERSYIFSVEGIYQLSTHWQLGEKLAWKRSMIQIDPILNNWETSDLYFWATRADYHLPFHWDLSLEYRMLKDTLADDAKSGFLVAGYRLIKEHYRIGIGYNFTDFNDDLENFSENAKGFFINMSYYW